MKRYLLKFIFLLAVLNLLILNSARGDIIYLKNGKKMQGLIKNETDTEVELDLGFGTTSISKSRIKSIKRSDKKEAEFLREKWADDARERSEAARQQKKEEHQIRQKQKIARKITKAANRPQSANVKYLERQGGIGVEAIIDDKVHAELLVDTGATSMLLSKHIADMLGISVLHGQITNMEVADGRIVKAVQIYLKSVSVDGMEVRDVMAHVLLNEEGLNNWDGLLGMSFLQHFVFHIDAANRELILERKID